MIKEMKEYYFGKTIEDKIHLIRAYIGVFILVIWSLHNASALYEGTNNIDSGLTEIITWEILNNDTWINATQISNSTVQITIPELTENLSFSILFKGYKNEEEKVVTIYSGGGGSTTIYKNNTIYEDIIKYKDRDIIREVNNTITLTNDIPNKLSRTLLWSAIILIFISVLAIYLYVREKKRLNQFIEETI